MKRRDFIRSSTLSVAIGTAGTATLLSTLSSCDATVPSESAKKSPLDDLKSMTDDIKQITVAERKVRIEKAQRLMTENKIGAIYLDGGTSMEYFTGIRWGNSERMMAAIIPAKGDIKYVSPHFEEARVRELMTIGGDVRVWEEHESPYKVVATIFSDFGIRTGKIAFEERVRFFLFDGIRKEASSMEYVSADPVTIPCRMFKSPAELALMQKANDITIESYRAAIPFLKEGMSPGDFSNYIGQAHSKLGARGGASLARGSWCGHGGNAAAGPLI